MLKDWMVPTGADVLLLLIVVGIFIALGGLGRLITPSSRTPFVVHTFTGWGVCMAILTLFGCLTDLPLWWAALPCIGLGGGAFICASMRDAPTTWSTWPYGILLAFIPLLLLICGMSATQWDDLAHWLPSAQYLFLFDHFPAAHLPASKSGWPAYPYGVPAISYIASLGMGHAVENAMPIWNTLTLLGLALMLKPTKTPATVYSYALATVGLIVIWPNFVPKIVFTSYADFPLAVVVCLLAVTALRYVETHNKADIITFGCLAILALCIKQVGLALLGITVIGGCLTTLLYHRSNLYSLWATGLFALLPALGIYLLWGHYTSQNIPGGEFSFRPLADWHWAALADMGHNTLSVMFSKSGYVLMMFGLTAKALHGFWKHDTSTAQKLSVMASVLFWGYNAFLFLCYLGAFSDYEARRVASLWRYNMHVGLLGFFAAFSVVQAWPFMQRATQKRLFSAIAVCALIIVIVAPVLLAKQLRFDNAPIDSFVRNVAADLTLRVPQEASIMVVEPETKGKIAIALKYHLSYAGNLSAYLTQYDKPLSAARILSYAQQNNAQYILAIFPNVGIKDILNTDLSSDNAYLLMQKNGTWIIAGHYPLPTHINKAKL